jgi:acetoacetyl-CoA reductase
VQLGGEPVYREGFVTDYGNLILDVYGLDIGFSKSLALEGAKSGVTVNVVAPGYTGTKMVMAVPEKVMESIKAGIPMGRLAQPEEIAAAVMYLVSDGAAYITGETINVNGGQYMH